MSAALIFVDFNEPTDTPEPAPPQPELPPPDPVADIRQEAWTEGYLSGCRAAGTEPPEATLMAKLLTGLHALGSEMTAAIDAAALTVAGLLVETIIAAAGDEWSATLSARVHALAQRLKPALAVAPEFLLRDAAGVEHRFADITALTRMLDAGVIAEDVTIAWQRGHATISRSALLEDLRHAVLPLSEGLVNEQPIRYLP